MLHEQDGAGDDRQPDYRGDASPHIFSYDSRGRLGWCGRPRQHPEHPHRLGDVLDRLWAEVLVAQRELVAEVLADGAGDTDAAGFGETLQTRRHVDPVAVDLFALDHHVAEVDPDTKLHPLVRRQVRTLGPERGLDYGGALHRVHHAGELCYDAVPCGINEAPAVMLDKAVDQLAVGSKGAQRRLFALPHEAAIAEDIGTEYGGELTFQYPPPSAIYNRASPVACQRAGLSTQRRPNPNVNYEGSVFRKAAVALNSGRHRCFPEEGRARLLVTGLVRRAAL